MNIKEKVNELIEKSGSIQAAIIIVEEVIKEAEYHNDCFQYRTDAWHDVLIELKSMI